MDLRHLLVPSSLFSVFSFTFSVLTSSPRFLRMSISFLLMPCCSKLPSIWPYISLKTPTWYCQLSSFRCGTRTSIRYLFFLLMNKHATVSRYTLSVLCSRTADEFSISSLYFFQTLPAVVFYDLSGCSEYLKRPGEPVTWDAALRLALQFMIQCHSNT